MFGNGIMKSADMFSSLLFESRGQNNQDKRKTGLLLPWQLALAERRDSAAPSSTLCSAR